jgi:hypothetical protein
MITKHKAVCGAQDDKSGPSRDLPLGPGQEPPLASHLVTSRTLYTHHGIYVGNGRVIHYSGLGHGVRRGPVEDTSLEEFAQGHTIHIRRDPRIFSRCQVVERARSRLGECRYQIFKNNCEHFCSWARRDESRSGQIERLRLTPRVVCRAFRAEYERIVQRNVAIARAISFPWLRPLLSALFVAHYTRYVILSLAGGFQSEARRDIHELRH